MGDIMGAACFGFNKQAGRQLKHPRRRNINGNSQHENSLTSGSHFYSDHHHPTNDNAGNDGYLEPSGVGDTYTDGCYVEPSAQSGDCEGGCDSGGGSDKFKRIHIFS